MAGAHVRYADGTHLPTTEEGKAAFLKELEQAVLEQLESLGGLLAEVRRVGLHPGDASLAELDALASEFAALDPREWVFDELLGLGSDPPAWWTEESWDGDDS
jgi:hypothetical protein